jgi:hypothetical protein
MSDCQHFKVRGRSQGDVQEAAARATDDLKMSPDCERVLVVYQHNAASLYVQTADSHKPEPRRSRRTNR